MVDVQDRAADAPASTRYWPGLLLTGAIAALAIVGIVPWERWCSFGGDGFPVVCFDAAIWSGSASLFGLLALIASVGFVALAIRRGRPWASDLSLPAVSLAATALVAAAVKIVVVVGDAATYSSEESGPRPVFAGTWLGLCLVILGVFVLRMVIARPPVRRAMIVWSLVVAGALIG